MSTHTGHLHVVTSFTFYDLLWPQTGSIDVLNGMNRLLKMILFLSLILFTKIKCKKFNSKFKHTAYLSVYVKMKFKHVNVLYIKLQVWLPVCFIFVFHSTVLVLLGSVMRLRHKKLQLSFCVVSQYINGIVSCKASCYASHGSFPDFVEH